MNRSEFITTAVGLLALSKINANQLKNYDPQLLIGKGKPKLLGATHQMLPEVYTSLQKMVKSANNDGIQIKVVSAYRSYDRQKAIWNRKYTHLRNEGVEGINAINKIIEYSTIPGTSRHHWGTDIDIIDGSKPEEGDVLVTKKFHGNGPYCSLREWMEANGHKFGFLRPYTQDPGRSGFLYEPWHYSYAKIAKAMLNTYLKLNITSLIKDSDLLGSHLLDSEFINAYVNTHVLGIDPALL